jgi:hypothetical protein
MQQRRDDPPGDDARLLARFHQLSGENRNELLARAIALVERQRDARLAPRDRELKKVIDRAARCLDLIRGLDGGTIEVAIWVGSLHEEVGELLALGFPGFGRSPLTPAPAASSRAHVILPGVAWLAWQLRPTRAA